MQITAQQVSIILASVGGTTYLVTAAVSTMPPKGSTWTWETIYDWFYDFAHMVINHTVPTKGSEKP